MSAAQALGSPVFASRNGLGLPPARKDFVVANSRFRLRSGEDGAVIGVEPAATPGGNPPGAMVATPVSEELQVAVDVDSRLLRPTARRKPCH